VALDRAAQLYTLLAVALADAFTSCWHEKYRTNLLPPVTYIRAHIDPGWRDNNHAPGPFAPRSFASFHAAAEEAAIFRLYGGIH
jgi:hypothetical protein